MKGFTLTELLAVLVILSMLFLIAIPIMDGVMEESKQNNYKFQITQIENASKNWALDNLLSITDEDETVTITLSHLKVMGYIGKDIKNPLTKTYFPNDMEILLTRKGIKFTSTVLENTGTNVDEFESDILVFILYGKVVEDVEINSAFTDSGIIFKNALGDDVTHTTEIRKNGAVVGSVNTASVGKYEISYTANNGTNISKVVRTVNIKDTVPPVISFPGANEISLSNLGTLDLDAGVTIVDNSGEALTYTKTGTVEPEIGSYVIAYSAVDSAGNKVKKSRLIKVVEDPIYVDASGAEYPVLRANMIPVLWNGSAWVKANLYAEWYDYTAKEWANAVLVTSGTRDAYNAAAPGTVITTTDILGHFVWIPRYRYSLFNVGFGATSASVIGVQFAALGDADSNGTLNGTYKTHPAFMFGTERVAGFWAGKFETTGSAATPTVLPGAAQLTGQTVSAQYDTSRLMTGATYGLTTDMDSHMARNMEWGAIAYLAASSFGKTGEVSAGSATYTGGGTGTSYATANTAQSTTGNVYGVYDMNGGESEYVMGAIYNSDNTTIRIRSAGFVQATIDGAAMAKYIDKYLYATTTTDYNRSKLGDALGETYGWYSNTATMPASNNTWLLRGANGLYSFSGTSGASNSAYGFRMILTPVTP